MIDIVENIIKNVLTALYQPFWFSVLLSVLFMFLYINAKEYGWRKSFHKWCNAFKQEKEFRRILALVFYTTMILFRTLLNRNMWENPVSDIMGGWKLYSEEGELSTEAIENLMLFVPFIILLMYAFKDKLFGDRDSIFVIVLQAVKIVFLFSISIEFAQLFLRLGTFQISDLVYNTLGGFLGGLIYWCGHKIIKTNSFKGDLHD